MNIPNQIDRYQIIEVLGQGGFAIVYLAFDSRVQRNVAIKLLNRTAAHDASGLSTKTARERFEDEVQILVKMEFDGVVRLYDYGEYQGQPYLVMQYMAGGTLSERIDGHPMPLLETAVILNRLCTSLEKVHQRGTIHRDLKPLNILFNADGEAYLSDFGIARLTENEGTTASIGTPRYMAPEQFDDKPLTIQTDIYQMGVILFEMLTGETPFNASTHAAVINNVLSAPIPSIADFVSDLDPKFDDIFKIAMAKNPAYRYESITDLAQHFAALVDDQPVPFAIPAIPASEPVPPLSIELPAPVPPPAAQEPPDEPANKRVKMIGIAAAITAVFLICLLGSGFLLARQLWFNPAENANPLVGIVATPTLNTEAALTVAAASTVTLAVPQPTAVAPTAEPRPTKLSISPQSSENVTAYRLNEPIIIDGNLDEWPSIPAVPSEHIVYQHQSWDGSEDIELYWQLAWDDVYLYIGATIFDDLHVQTETGNRIFRGDSLSLQIDADRAGDMSDFISPDDFQIDLSPGNFTTIAPSAQRYQGNSDRTYNSISSVSILVDAQQTDFGYLLEAAIPWADLGLNPNNVAEIGLALNATDDDSPNSDVQELFVSNVAGRTFNKPNSWGILRLEAEVE